MSHPSQDPQAYPWGPPSGQEPGDPAAGRPADPHGGAQHGPQHEPEPQHEPQPGFEHQPPQAAQEAQWGSQPQAGHGPQYGPAAPASAPQPWTGYAGTPAPAPGQGGQAPTSTVVLLVLSGIAVVTGLFSIAGIAGLVLGIIALTKANNDPAAARRLTRIGWWVLIGAAVLSLLLLAGLIAGLVAFGTQSDPFSGSSPDYGGAAWLS